MAIAGLVILGATNALQLATRLMRDEPGSVMSAQTPRAALEAAVAQRESRIRELANLAEVGKAVGVLAHEIRNPLNSITLFVQLIKSGPDEPEKLEYIEKILKEIDRIDNILRKLLDASKRPMYEIREVRIDQVIDGILDTFRPQIEVKKVRVERLYHRIPPAIPADAAEIEQIFTNLFLNAIAAMEQGGHLRVSLKRRCRIGEPRGHCVGYLASPAAQLA